MTVARKTGSTPARTLPEAITRTLRHDVGDLLQTIYATVAILQKRLPPGLELERRVIADLRTRAEGCKNLLDTVHDYVCSIALASETVDVADLADKLVAAAAPRYPQLQLRAEAASRPQIGGDGRRISQIGNILLTNACEAARQKVWFRTASSSDGEEAVWSVSDDGPGVPEADLDQLFSPFYTTRHGHLGLGLPLAQKLVEMHGGRMTTENGPEGGLRVQVFLPTCPPERNEI